MLTTVTQAIQGSFTFLLDDHLEQQQQTLENHSKPFIDEEGERSKLRFLGLSQLLECLARGSFPNVFLYFKSNLNKRSLIFFPTAKPR